MINGQRMKVIKIGVLFILNLMLLFSCRKDNRIVGGNETGSIPPKHILEDTTLPFFGEIEKFEYDDSLSFPPQNAILFVGSSSIRLWQNINSYFPDFNLIKRGFGGSGLKDLTNYVDDIIIPYRPKQVVIYSGENDIASGKANASDILLMFTSVFNKIRTEIPGASIVYISIKPSPKLKNFMPVEEKSNVLVRNFLASQLNTAYVDVYNLMLGADGNPLKELFKSDGLHMTVKGYQIWKDAIAPVLLK
jgi:lysophospholipase L1-like esterase